MNIVDSFYLYLFFCSLKKNFTFASNMTSAVYNLGYHLSFPIDNA
ncbi:hypothetical protein SAMN05444362_108171 [Dysgonomonas macrotermitis]|uniref:Uncharacterized protein n=1 Tax=Dysgonomonas macrotermitis TaxID=1346286 RepID=A0A1M5DEY1_9BACT|nr:hypothetical protein SAMN05444362_108171 [Dysgonomonas macrotermitis]